ncbi:MAG: endonuclease/exonuclease/phosphatase family protein [Nitrospirota bacterium]|nr:MAG: endonuclease/exonuclease/phosphatase family protein [Nitrospirota bacterium]
MDRRVMPRRIAEVLSPFHADIIALQEVLGGGPKGRGQDEELGAALGMGWVMAPTRLHRGSPFGNVILSRFPIVSDTQYDLTWKHRRPRCCQRADIHVGRHTLHLYNVHLGTGLRERHHQTERLSTILEDGRIRAPKIVLGDFNEWGRGLAAATLTPKLNSLNLRSFLKRRRTYPGFFPLLHLDHIFYDGKVEMIHVQVPRSRLSLIASDHLPIVADIRIRF